MKQETLDSSDSSLSPPLRTPPPRTTTTQSASEDSKPEAPLEWWFFQGRYTSRDAGRREFMLSLFRMNLHVKTQGQRDGFKLILAIFDPEATSEHDTVTWVDRPSFEALITELEAPNSKIDVAIQQAMLSELKQQGPPAPIRVKAAPERFAASPLAVCWGGFRLSQQPHGFRLEFPEPRTDARVRLDCIPSVATIDVDSDPPAGYAGHRMHYRSIPRLTVHGDRDTVPVEGSAWMDHQWGQWGWLQDPKSGSLLGWDWFGINLSDGSDWVVLLRREVRSGAPIVTHVSVRSKEGELRRSQELRLKPLRYWESPATHIAYPVAWEISVPEFRTVLRFDPLCDAQEVYALGPLRGLWEGAGVVSGSLNGVPVTGIARGEFCGYGYVFDYQAFLEQMGRRVDLCLENFLPREIGPEQVRRYVGPAIWQHEPAAYTRTISEPIWDLIQRSGKRWRPIFGVLLLEAMGVRSGPWEGLIATMTELIHTACLIVDDIQDGSTLRRGTECIHQRYGIDVALSAANTLYFLPGIVLLEHPMLTAKQRAELHEIKERVLIEAHCGQATDIHWSRELTEERLAAWLSEGLEEKVLQMYAFKTGAGAKGLAESAAVIADASPEVRDAAANFALKFAVAFQIVDDVLNFSRSAKWRKTCGEDLLSGKPTYVIVKALRSLRNKDKRRLTEILCSSDLRRQQPIVEQGIALIERSGALESCRTQARSMTEDAWRILAPRIPPSEPKILLHAMCRKLLDLAYDG